MKTFSEMAPLKLPLSEAETVALRQVIWFKMNGFGILTARHLLGLTSTIGGSWDQTWKEAAVIWENIRAKAEAESQKQALYRQISLDARGASEGQEPEISGPSSQVPLCQLWAGRSVGGTHPDGA